MPKRASPSLLSAAHLEAMTECRSLDYPAAFKHVRHHPTASCSDYSLSDSEDDDDDDAASVLSSCGSSASDQSLLSSAFSRALPGHPVEHGSQARRRQTSCDGSTGVELSSTMSAAAFPVKSPRMEYLQGAGLEQHLAEANIPTTDDLDEALRSNGRLAYVPSSSNAASPDIAKLVDPGELITLPALPAGKTFWAAPPGGPPGTTAVAAATAAVVRCPCAVCQGAGVLPAALPDGQVSFCPDRQLDLNSTPAPASPQSCLPEECSYYAPIPSSLAIAAALASGHLPFPIRPEELASQVPPMSPLQPPLTAYIAALLVASAASPGALAAAPEPGCQMAFPLPGRPLNLPLSLPSLMPASALPMGL